MKRLFKKQDKKKFETKTIGNETISYRELNGADIVELLRVEDSLERAFLALAKMLDLPLAEIENMPFPRIALLLMEVVNPELTSLFSLTAADRITAIGTKG